MTKYSHNIAISGFSSSPAFSEKSDFFYFSIAAVIVPLSYGARPPMREIK